jgi:hypothetical protein
MSWRKPETRDLTAKLNQREVTAFKQHPDFATMADPASDILEQTAEMVRGYCRTNKQVKMSPVLGTIPEGLMSAAMDYAAFDVLKRINVQPNEARKAAWEKALELFEKVARGEYIPESWADDPSGGDDASSNRAMPGFTPNARYKILNEYPQI